MGEIFYSVQGKKNHFEAICFTRELRFDLEIILLNSHTGHPEEILWVKVMNSCRKKILQEICSCCTPGSQKNKNKKMGKLGKLKKTLFYLQCLDRVDKC